MAYRSIWVFNSILKLAQNDKVNDIDALKAMKLVYFMHGWYLATMGESVLGDKFENWSSGPMLSSLFYIFLQKERNLTRPFKRCISDISPITGEDAVTSINSSDTKFHDVLIRVWNRYKNYTGVELAGLANANGTPWDMAHKRGDVYLSNDEIQQHFISLGNLAKTPENK